MTSRPQLTLQIDDVPALPAGQPLTEGHVAIVRDQFPQQSYANIDRFVSDWQRQQQNTAPVTVRQTTTTTNEIVLPAPQQPPPPRFTSEQLAARFAAFQPLVA